MNSKSVFTVCCTAVYCIILIASCKSSEVIKESNPPFSGALLEDSLALRTIGLGESKVLSTARTISLHDAQVKMSGMVVTYASNQASNYTKQYTMGENTPTAVKFEDTSKTITEVMMKNMRVVDEKYTRDASGKYAYWILLEVRKEWLSPEIQTVSNQTNAL